MKNLLLILLLLSFSSYAIEDCPVIPKSYNPLELEYDVHEKFMPSFMESIENDIEAGVSPSAANYRYSKEYKSALDKYMKSGTSSKEICDNATEAAVRCSFVNMAGAELLWKAASICKNTLELNAKDQVKLESKEKTCFNEVSGDHSIARFERATCILNSVRSLVK